MKKLIFGICVFLFFLIFSSIGFKAQEADIQAIDDAYIFFVHGVPGQDIGEAPNFPVDLYVNGILKKSNVKYGKISARFKVTSGDLTFAVYRNGKGPGAGYEPIIEQVFKIQYYENASVVVYLDPDRNIKLVKFTNDLSLTGHATKCKVIIHNTSEEAKLGFWLYNDNSRPPYEYRPWMGSDILEPGDKNVFEIAKAALVGNRAILWWLEIGIGWEDWHTVYDKAFAFQPRKGVLVFFVGSTATKTFKVVRKMVPLK